MPPYKANQKYSDVGFLPTDTGACVAVPCL